MFEHRDAFISTLRAGPDMRKRIFDSLEQRFAHGLGTGQQGKILYDALHSAVRDADVPGAAEEFESRFLPLVNPARSRREVDAPDQDQIAVVDGRSGRRGWIAASCAMVIIVGALALGLVVLNDMVAKAPTRTNPIISHVQETEPAAEAPKQAGPTQVIRDLQDPPSER
jgi:cytochrome c biogenesis protein ResB